MEFALASFFTVSTAAGAAVYRWQSYQANGVIDGHTFFPFNLGEIVDASSGAADSLQVEFPLTNETYGLLENGIEQRFLASAFVYLFEPTAGGGMPGSKTLVAAYYGEIVSGRLNDQRVIIEVGSRLDGVEAHVPARVFTIALVGSPPKM